MVTDLYGRQLDGVLTNTQTAAMILADIKEKIAYQPEAQAARDTKLDEIVELLQGISTDLQEETAAVREVVTRTVNNSNSVGGAAGSTKPRHMGDVSSKCCWVLLTHVKRIDKNIATIASTLAGGRIPGLPKKTSANAAAAAAASATGTAFGKPPKGASPKMVNVAAAGINPPQPPHTVGPVMSGAGGPGGSGGHGGSLALTAQELAKLISSGSNKFMSGIGIDLTSIFRGVLKDSVDFVKNMRFAAYETRDWSESSKDVAKNWIEAGLQAKETGADRATFQNIYTKQVQQGLSEERREIIKNGKLETVYQRRSIKDQQRMVKTAMNTAYMIGAGAEDTAEVFSQWQRTLGLSNAEMDHMSDSMKNIARTTGVSGQNLLDAAKASQSIFKELQRSGSLTAESMANVTQTMALAKKYGVEDKMGEVMSALSSPSAFMKSDPRTRSLMIRGATRGGVFDEVLAGSATSSRGTMDKILTGMGDATFDLLKGNLPTMKSLKDLPKIIKQLDMGIADEKVYGNAQQQRMRSRSVKLMMEQSGGMGPGDIERMLKVQEENKSPVDKMQQLMEERTRKQAAGKDLTDVNKRIKETQTAIDTERYNTYRETLQQSSDKAEAMKTTQTILGRNLMGGFTEGDLTATTTNLVKGMQSEGKELGITSKFNETLQQSQFKSWDQLVAGMQSSDKDTADEAGAVFHSLQNELDIARKNAEDPVTKMQQHVKEINDNIAKIASSWVMKMTDTMLLAIVAAGTLGQVAGPIMGLANKIMGLKAFLGGGGGAVSGMATKAGGLLARTGGAALGMGRTALSATGGALTTLGEGSLASGLAKVAGPLAVLIGAVKGWTEADEAGVSGLTGAGFGALTGGAKTGTGWLGRMVGIQEGSTVDKAGGVLESAGWGAAAGAGIGALFGGVGAAPGALIGAGVGATAEIIKIFWEPIKSAIGWVAGKIGDIFVGIGNAIWGAISWVAKGVWSIFSGIGKVLWSGISWIGEKLAYVFSPLKEALDYVWEQAGEFFGWFGDMWKYITEGASDFFTGVGEFFTGLGVLLKPIWDGIVSGFQELGSALAPIFTPIMDFIKGVGGFIGTVLSFIPVLQILKAGIGLIGQAIMLAVDIIKVFLQLITLNWSGAWETIKKSAIRIGNWLTTTFTEIFGNLPQIIWDAMSGLGAFVTGIFSTAIQTAGGLLKQLPATIISALTGLPKALWDAFINALSRLGSGISTFVDTWVVQPIKTAAEGIASFGNDWLWQPIKTAFLGFKDWVSSTFQGFVDWLISLLPDWLKSFLGITPAGAGGAADKAVADAASAAKPDLEKKVQENITKSQKDGTAQPHNAADNPAKDFWTKFHSQEQKITDSLTKVTEKTTAGDKGGFAEGAKEALKSTLDMVNVGAEKGMDTRTQGGRDVWQDTIKSIEGGAATLGVNLDEATKGMLSQLKQRVAEDDLQNKLRNETLTQSSRMGVPLTPEQFNARVAEKRGATLRTDLTKEAEAGNAGLANVTAQNLLSDMMKTGQTRYGASGIDQWTETVNALRNAQKRGIAFSPEVEKQITALEGRSRREYKESYVRQDMIRQGYFPGTKYGAEQRTITKEEYDKHVGDETTRLLKEEGFGADGVKADKAADASVKLTEEATKKGSIYVHDTHCEKILAAILGIMSGKGVLSDTVDDILAESLPSPSSYESSYADMGLFDEEQPGEAMDQAISDVISHISMPTETGPNLLEDTNELLAEMLDVIMEIADAGPPVVEVFVQGGRTTAGRARVNPAEQMLNTVGRIVAAPLNFVGRMITSPVETIYDTMTELAEAPFNIFKQLTNPENLQGANEEERPGIVDAVAQGLGLFDIGQGREAMGSADDYASAMLPMMSDIFTGAIFDRPVFTGVDFGMPNYSDFHLAMDRTPGGTGIPGLGYGANFGNDVKRIIREGKFDQFGQPLQGSAPLGMGLFDYTMGGQAISGAQDVENSRLGIPDAGQTQSIDKLIDAQRQRVYDVFRKPAALMQSLGLFDANQGRDANEESDNYTYQQMMMGKAGFMPGHPAVTGLGTPLGATAESQRLTEIMEKKKLAEEAKRMATVLNTGLFEEKNVKETENETISNLSRFYGRDLNALPGAPTSRPGAASTSRALYYTDEQNAQVNTPSYYEGAKGSVSTNLISMDDAENYVARMVEGEKPTGPTALVPGLDAILDYLSEEAADREERMIRILEQIRDQKLQTGYPPLDPQIPGKTAYQHSNIRNWSRDIMRGHWPEAMSGTYSEQSNHTGDIRK